LTSREGGQNPGNNLHVSGLSSRVDTRDLEAAFAKIGRVSAVLCIRPDINLRYSRLKKHRSCMTPTLASLAVSAL
jgi:transformer-2 protein